MFVWSKKFFGWFELTPEEEDELCDWGDAVAEGRISSQEVIDRILARRGQEINGEEAPGREAAPVATM